MSKVKLLVPFRVTDADVDRFYYYGAYQAGSGSWLADIIMTWCRSYGCTDKWLGHVSRVQVYEQHDFADGFIQIDGLGEFDLRFGNRTTRLLTDGLRLHEISEGTCTNDDWKLAVGADQGDCHEDYLFRLPKGISGEIEHAGMGVLPEVMHEDVAAFIRSLCDAYYYNDSFVVPYNEERNQAWLTFCDDNFLTISDWKKSEIRKEGGFVSGMYDFRIRFKEAPCITLPS